MGARGKCQRDDATYATNLSAELNTHSNKSKQQQRKQQATYLFLLHTSTYITSSLFIYCTLSRLTMNRFVSLCLIVVALVASSVQGFAPSSLGGISGGELHKLFETLLFHVRILMSSNSKPHITLFILTLPSPMQR